MTLDFRVTFAVGAEDVQVSARAYESEHPTTAWLILAHGAGAGHDSAFIVSYARAFAALGLTTVTFNFPYTERGRRLPDPPRVLEACWMAIIAAVRRRAGVHARIVAGGKSMGGRIASQVAADTAAAQDLDGLVFLGYPLHPPGRPEQRRTAHWPNVPLPSLFVQGTRDTFASPEELRRDLPRFGGPATVVVVPGGDHSFKVTREAGRPQAAVHAAVQAAVEEWISRLPHRPA